MRLILDVIAYMIWIAMFSFPVWINRKTIFNKQERESRRNYNKECKEQRRLSNNQKTEIQNKICTQYQPFQLTETEFAVCNFICNGECQFKGSKYYIEK